MKYIILGVGLLLFLFGFVDSGNPVSLFIGLSLLVLGWKFDVLWGELSSKNAANKLLKLGELRDKGAITEDEYAEKAKALKSKL